MHRIGQKTTLQERATIEKLEQLDEPNVQIAANLYRSAWTARKWRRILSSRGGLASGIGWHDRRRARSARFL